MEKVGYQSLGIIPIKGSSKLNVQESSLNINEGLKNTLNDFLSIH
jgi:hypothetical protein